ncbi:hypothetical protein B566_EDAN001217 [Ephemera danica]|nr:hypothetical protein B566_EDAN001217 [Ephemera danica]
MSKKILCVGLTCMDMVQTVKEYPKEDTDQRSISARWQRGGNASNNCTVLSQLGVNCEFLGTIGQDLTVKFVEDDFASLNINIEHCEYITGANSPISTVIVNSQNGSRTIIHNRGTVKELSREQFKKVKFQDYQWIHFEGRNVEVIMDVLKEIDAIEAGRPRTSVELEKPYRELDVLIPLADLVFLSREYSESRGWTSGEQAVTLAIYCYLRMGSTSPAYPPAQVVDTLGAGDTFVAGVLVYQLQGVNMKKSIEFGCKLAGVKVGQQGLKGLEGVLNHSLS